MTYHERGRQGLGFADPATVKLGWDVGKGIFDDLFGGYDPDKDPEQLAEWGSAIASGRQAPCPGPFDVEEVRRAVAVAPEGHMGDPSSFATKGGLRQAIVQEGLPGNERMGVLAPYIQTDDALARVAVGVAHGNIDCIVGWHEEPAAEHLHQILAKYPDRVASAPQGYIPGVGSSGPSNLGIPLLGALATAWLLLK